MTSPACSSFSFFLSKARDLRGPGLRAYFLCEQKVGKKSLRKRGFLRTFLITGVMFFAPEAQISGLNLLLSAYRSIASILAWWSVAPTVSL